MEFEQFVRAKLIVRKEIRNTIQLSINKAINLSKARAIEASETGCVLASNELHIALLITEFITNPLPTINVTNNELTQYMNVISRTYNEFIIWELFCDKNGYSEYTSLWWISG
jgi:hypothetical protein